VEPASVIAISAGGNHTCALFAGGTIKCWGENTDGQLGNGNTVGSPTPVPVRGISGVVQVSTGITHNCALVSGGTVKCWGRNDFSQLGDETQTDNSRPVTVSGIANATQVSAGGGFGEPSPRGGHSCAVLTGGTIKCWGSNRYGQLGNGAPAVSSAVPVQVSGITNAIQVSVGGAYTCAVLNSGAVKCWGINDYGQLGNGTKAYSATPVQVSGISTATQVSAGYHHTCALVASDLNHPELGGTIECWGERTWNLLGMHTDRLTPVTVRGISAATQLSVAGDHTCALVVNDLNRQELGGAIRCWGENKNGELGNGRRQASSPPVTVQGITNATQVSASDDGRGAYSLSDPSGHSCALLAGGTIKCWGSNSAGELGNGKQGNRVPPIEVSGIGNATAVSAGGYFTCARLSSGKIKCWGVNAHGQLGDGSTKNRSTPVVVKRTRKAIAVSATGGYEYWSGQACVLLVGGTLRCWGDGPLGNRKHSRRGSSVPVAVKGVEHATVLSGNGEGGVRRCVVLRGGRVECWGRGKDRGLPVLIDGIRNAVSVSVGAWFVCALLRNGTIKCWGDNYDGELGDGSRTHLSRTPVAVRGITNARMISAGDGHACAVLSGGMIKCWGSDEYGELGNGKSRTSSRLPVTVKGIRSATAVATGDIGDGPSFSCALLRNGRVECWGANYSGQLGDGVAHHFVEGRDLSNVDNIDISPIPVEVRGITRARTISAGHSHACARLANRTVMCWGSDAYGQLGDGGALDYPTPVDVIGLS